MLCALPSHPALVRLWGFSPGTLANKQMDACVILMKDSLPRTCFCGDLDFQSFKPALLAMSGYFEQGSLLPPFSLWMYFVWWSDIKTISGKKESSLKKNCLSAVLVWPILEPDILVLHDCLGLSSSVDDHWSTLWPHSTQCREGGHNVIIVILGSSREIKAAVEWWYIRRADWWHDACLCYLTIAPLLSLLYQPVAFRENTLNSSAYAF